MPARSPRPCTKTGCGGTAVAGKGTCPAHTSAVRRTTDTRRGSSTARGYGARHQRTFRTQVLREQPWCVLCGQPSTVADHYPRSRRDLLASGCDPDDPSYGRGLCKPCHDRHTGVAQPGHRFGSR